MLLPTDIILQPGDGGEYVRELQRRLAQRSLLSAANINSFYDGPTTAAVKSFQFSNGLTDNGIAGSQTLRRLHDLGTFGDSSGSSEDSSASDEPEEEQTLTNKERLYMTHEMYGEASSDPMGNDAIRDGYEEDVDQTLNEWEQEAEKDLSQQQDKALEQERHLLQKELLEQQQGLAAEHDPEQLKVTTEGVEARTVMDDLKEEGLTKETADKQAEIQKDLIAQQNEQIVTEQHELEAQQQIELPQETEAQQQVAPKAVEQSAERTLPAQPKAEMDPDARQAGEQLSAPSQQQTQEEGQHLQADGVENQGPVSERDLGKLTPDHTPGMGKTREVSMGM